MKWITRANANVDRVACPWLIRRFIDPDAEFLFAPAEQVTAASTREGAARGVKSPAPSRGPTRPAGTWGGSAL